MDKTYTEKLGYAAFDWRHALRHPEQYAHETLVDKAQSWTTCACGNQCAIIPRYGDESLGTYRGEPIDEELSDLGADFYFEVRNKRYGTADAILDHIENRSKILIEIELAKLNAREANNASQVPA